MTNMNRMQQLLNVRKMKVDQITTQMARARQHFAQSQKTYESTKRRYEDLASQGGFALEDLIAHARDVKDPHNQFRMIQKTLIQQRANEEIARKQRDQAEVKMGQAQTELRGIAKKLSEVTGRAEAVGTLVERAVKAEQNRLETIEEEEQLDDFAAQAHSSRNGGPG